MYQFVLMRETWVKQNKFLENYVEINLSVNQYERELGLGQQL